MATRHQGLKLFHDLFYLKYRTHADEVTVEQHFKGKIAVLRENAEAIVHKSLGAKLMNRRDSHNAQKFCICRYLKPDLS